MATAADLRTQFEDHTGYEALVLTSLTDARQMEMGQATEARDDIRGTTKHFVRGMAENLGGAAARAAVEPFRALVFGAAYKALDLAVEMVMALNAVPQPAGRWTFVEKQKYARTTASPAQLPVPLDSAPEIWTRLAALYDAFLEPRHAIVHRRVTRDAAGNLQPYDQQGRAITVVGAGEMESFALAVYGLRQAIVRARPDERRLNAIAWHLDALGAVHGLPAIGAEEPRPIARLIVDNVEGAGDGRWRMNVAKIADHIAGQDGVRFADLELHAQHGDVETIFNARFEDVPTGDDAIEFSEYALPSWLALVQRT